MILDGDDSFTARRPWARRWAWTLLVALLATGCGPMPQDPVERALYDDLRLLVRTREATEWLIDDYEIQAIAPNVLRSVCQVDAPQREGLRQWLSAQILAQGGPAEQAWVRNGGDLGAISQLLSLERTLMVLEWSEGELAHRCPFFLVPQADFGGVHSNAHRWVLLAESAGGGAAYLRDGALRFGGGGSARLLIGRGLNASWSLATGAEFGGGGAFSIDDPDNPSLSASAFVAWPWLLRYRHENQVFDIDLAAISTFDTQRFEWPPGGRISLGAGIITPRIGSFMPTVVLQVGYELHPPAKDRGYWHGLRLGTRIGVDFDW